MTTCSFTSNVHRDDRMWVTRVRVDSALEGIYRTVVVVQCPYDVVSDVGIIQWRTCMFAVLSRRYGHSVVVLSWSVWDELNPHDLFYGPERE